MRIPAPRIEIAEPATMRRVWRTPCDASVMVKFQKIE
jgi:hypothetical protein